MASVKDRLIVALWRALQKLGPTGRRRLAVAWRHTVGRLPLRGHRQWCDNVERATGIRPTGAGTRLASAWWLRNALESVTLERWSPQEVDDAVMISEADWARLNDAFEGPGAVLALGHIGSWDLCGAWACRRGMPVTSVVERLTDVRYERFLDARRAMGMRIYTLGEADTFARLIEDVRARRLVCLLADRDLAGDGLAMTWPSPNGPLPIRVPAGPAMLARRTGAELLVVTSFYEGERLRIEISEPVAHQSGPEGLKAMMQGVVEELAGAVTRHPADWHMFGRYFGR